MVNLFGLYLVVIFVDYYVVIFFAYYVVALYVLDFDLVIYDLKFNDGINAANYLQKYVIGCNWKQTLRR